jgi:hypothetical protein
VNPKMNKRVLQEYLKPSVSRTIVESEDTKDGKTLYMKGLFIEGNVRNANERIYPAHEIANAVKTLTETIREHGGVLGELDHPDDLKINLDRVSHTIVAMDMDGANGYGKLKILPTPMGQLVKTMLENGVKLGVSSRGSGNVDDSTGKVSEFEIVTVDIVAQPSAPHAYPSAIYESIMNMKHGHRLIENIKGKNIDTDAKLKSYVRQEMLRFIKDLKQK